VRAARSGIRATRAAPRRRAKKAVVGLRLDAEQEFNGADFSIHKITSTPER
jgi:hypothetical protein